MKETVEIKNLTTGFRLKKDDAKILHEGLRLELKNSELVCILGPNGAGKSTLLKTMLGFEKAISGSVFFMGQPLDILPVKELSRMVSVVLTDKIDDFYLTAFEVALTGRYPHASFTGKPNEKDISMVNDAFQKVGVLHLSGQSFYKLSDGEKQKVMIARAIVQDTPFIFLDEPVAYVDPPGKIAIMYLLKKLSLQMNKGILVATHDLESALNYADELWLLGTGGKWKTGKPEELVEAGFINEFFDSGEVRFNRKNHRFEWEDPIPPTLKGGETNSE